MFVVTFIIDYWIFYFVNGDSGNLNKKIFSLNILPIEDVQINFAGVKYI